MSSTNAFSFFKYLRSFHCLVPITHLCGILGMYFPLRTLKREADYRHLALQLSRAAIEDPDKVPLNTEAPELEPWDSSSLGCPGTRSVDQVVPKLRNLPFTVPNIQPQWHYYSPQSMDLYTRLWVFLKKYIIPLPRIMQSGIEMAT